MRWANTSTAYSGRMCIWSAYFTSVERKFMKVIFYAPTMSFWKMINFIIPACCCFIHFISLHNFFSCSQMKIKNEKVFYLKPRLCYAPQEKKLFSKFPCAHDSWVLERGKCENKKQVNSMALIYCKFFRWWWKLWCVHSGF